MSSSPVDLLKQAAAEAAASRVVSGTVVGLGTGSTAIHAVPALARRLRSGELQDIRAVATSFQSTMLARELGIRLVDLDEIERIDISIDGADEVAPDLTLIKGGGGARPVRFRWRSCRSPSDRCREPSSASADSRSCGWR
jgi:ribose 5-phosphate isomerase A